MNDDTGIFLRNTIGQNNELGTVKYCSILCTLFKFGERKSSLGGTITVITVAVTPYFLSKLLVPKPQNSGNHRAMSKKVVPFRLARLTTTTTTTLS